jgi:PAS domain S-box-containing protein
MTSAVSAPALFDIEPGALLTALVEGSQDAIIAQGLDATILSWNPGAERIYGYSAEEIIGRSMNTIVPEEKVSELPALYSRLHQGERVGSLETVRRTKDGRLIDISLTVSPIRDASNRVIGFSSIARDITERKRADEEDRQRQRLLIDFVENATEGLHWVGPDGVILWANRSELESLGYSQEEYVGHNIAEFHVDEPVICDILRRLTAGEKLDGYEARMRCKDGSIRHVLINSSVYFDQGKFIHTRCFTRDITARRAAQEALVEAQEKLRRHAEELERQVELRTAHLQHTVQSLEGMCYTMAHDLRGPLRSLRSFTEILVGDYASKFDEDGRLYGERILAATSRMDALIRDLLEFARLSHTALPLAAVDLNEQVEGWRQHFDHELKSRDAQLVVAEPLPIVTGNRVLLDQVFINLIANALKFTRHETSPSVEIFAEAADGHATVHVRDNGIGIAPEHRERIFGLFQRLHTAQEYPGTGVGLAIVRKALERLGGSVNVDSVVGKGSTFHVRLPLATGQSE